MKKMKSMNPNQIAILSIIMLIAIAVGVYYLRSDVDKDKTMESGEEMMMDEEETSMEEDETMLEDNDYMDGSEEMKIEDEETSSGRYLMYSESELKDAQERGDSIVLYFYATWCPSCAEQNENLTKDKSEIPSNITILKVDYDKYTSLKKKYGVTIQHTFVQVDSKGNEIKQWNELYGDYSLKTLLDQTQ